jgi:phosphoenolpyruvate---glycerone phosphotransferase subunit DhaK
MAMKKLINHPDRVVDELIEGCVLANPKLVRKHPRVNAVIRVDAPVEDKVGIVIGGGAGHEPLFLEYVGPGMADASAHGQVFAAPSPDVIIEAIHAVDAGRGIMLLYNNYAGDCLNFDIAQDMAREKGIEVETVLVNDEIASAPKGSETDRRGTTADHVIIKIAGAMAEINAPLSEVVRVTRKAIAGARSLGVGLSSCTLPATGREIFDIGDDEMEIGMGLHGEPGVERTKLLSADETVEQIIPRIVEDLPYRRGDEVILVINGYGATTRMEMFIVNRKIRVMLAKLKIQVHATEIGEFCTSQEMKGLSITLVKVDDELKAHFNAPCKSSFYVRF